MAPTPRSRLVRRWLGGGLALALAWVLLAAALVLWGSRPDRLAHADVIIVLGAAAYGTEPSPVLRERLTHGVDLFRRELAPRLLLTGGKRKASDLSEAEVARRFVEAQGVPAEAVLLEELSTSTWQNLENARELMERERLSSAVVVSDPLHLARAGVLARRLGIRAQTSPTPTSRFRSLGTQLPFLLREIYHLTVALLGLQR